MWETVSCQTLPPLNSSDTQILRSSRFWITSCQSLSEEYTYLQKKFLTAWSKQYVDLRLSYKTVCCQTEASSCSTLYDNLQPHKCITNSNPRFLPTSMSSIMWINLIWSTWLFFKCSHAFKAGRKIMMGITTGPCALRKNDQTAQ